MLINNNYSNYGYYYYNQLSIEQKQEVNNICNSLGISIGELEFYFGFIVLSIGNVSFFAFVLLLKNKPNLINNLRAQAAAMGFGAFGFLGNFGGPSVPSYNFPTNPPTPTIPTLPPITSPITPPTTPPVTPPTTPPTLPPNIPPITPPEKKGDAFLTIFSPEDLETLKNGGSLDLKKGILGNLEDLSKYDKNGDGKISGDELKDVQVTIDYDKDGKVDKDEVKSAKDANIKEIDPKTGKVITNDGKEFDLKKDKVNIGGEDKTAIIVDSNKDGKPTKDADNKLEPGDFKQFGSKKDSKSESSTGSPSSGSSKYIDSSGSSGSTSTSGNSSSTGTSGSSGASSSKGSSGSSGSSGLSGSSGSSSKK